MLKRWAADINYMKFEGKIKLDAERGKVWDFISDPSKVIGCVPGLQSYKVHEGKYVTAIVKVGIGFIRGTFNASSKVLEESPEDYKAKLELAGSGAGSAFNAKVDIKLDEAKGGGTELTWEADVNISGPMGSLARPMLEGYVKKLVEQVFDCVKKKLS